MDRLQRFHHDWAYLSILISFGAGFWMLAALKLKNLKRLKYFYVPVYIGWAAMVLQVLLGVSLYMSGAKVPSEKGFHYFYGFLLFVIATVIWSYRNSLPKDRKILIYGLVSIFMGGMALRSALLVLL